MSDSKQDAETKKKPRSNSAGNGYKKATVISLAIALVGLVRILVGGAICWMYPGDSCQYFGILTIFTLPVVVIALIATIAFGLAGSSRTKKSNPKKHNVNWDALIYVLLGVSLLLAISYMLNIWPITIVLLAVIGVFALFSYGLHRFVDKNDRK